jgi:hypothetical protein
MAFEEDLTSDEAAVIAKALELSFRFEREAVGELRASTNTLPELKARDFLIRTTRAVRDDREHPWFVSHLAFELILRAFSPGADELRRPMESPIQPAWRALAEGDTDVAEGGGRRSSTTSGSARRSGPRGSSA